MPFVHIKIIGQTPETRGRIAQATARAITEATGIPTDSIWIVFEEIDADDWFVSERSVSAMRRGSHESGGTG